MYTYICHTAPQKVTSHVSNSEFLALIHSTPRIIVSEKQTQQKELDGFGKESSSNLPTLAINCPLCSKCHHMSAKCKSWLNAREDGEAQM